MKKSFLAILVMPFLATNVLAGNLTAPFGLSSAKVLPKGVRNLNYKGLMVSGTAKFDDHGSNVLLADPLIKNVTIGSMITGSYNGADAAKLESVKNKMGASDDDLMAQTIGQVNVSALANVPILAWGFSKNFTAAIAVPVTFASINVDTGVKHTNPALYNEFLDAISSSPSAQAEFNRKMSNPVQEKLKDDGYDPLENMSGTKLGDIKLVGKYMAYQNMKNSIVVGADITLPTGEEADVDKVINLPGGDGQTDVGFNIAHDYRLSGRMTLSTSVAYNIQIQDRAFKRVPIKSDSSISPDKELVDRDLGDSVSANIGVKYEKNGFSIGTGYNYQLKEKDIYSGTLFDNERYTWMSNDTEQEMHAIQATLGYNTISLFRQKKFPVPLAVGLTHSQLIEGRNVTNDPLTTLDLSVFF